MSDILQVSINSIDYHNKRVQVALSNLAQDGMVVSGSPSQKYVSLKKTFNSYLEPKVIEISSAATKKVTRPDSPYADTEGFVTIYSMNKSGLVAEALEAYRMYESSIRALGLYNKITTRSYDIGR